MEYQTPHETAPSEEIWKILRALTEQHEKTSRRLDKLAEKEARHRKQEARYREEEAQHKEQEAQHREQEAQHREQEAQHREQEAWYKEEEARHREQEARYREEEARYREEEAHNREAQARYREEEAQRKKEADQRGKEIDKRMRELQELFTGQWGKLMESLVEGDLLRLLGQKGIAVDDTTTRYKGQRNGRQFEFDIIASNGDEIVVVEVKTTLRVENVNEFLWEMEQFTDWLPRYRDKRVYGAVAYLQVVEEAEKYAARKGLFVIRATGSSASIINAEGFLPRVFS